MMPGKDWPDLTAFGYEKSACTWAHGVCFLPHCDPRITWHSAVLLTSLPIGWLWNAMETPPVELFFPVKSTEPGLWWKMIIPPFCEWSNWCLQCTESWGRKRRSIKNGEPQKHFLISLSNHNKSSCWRQIIKLWTHCPLINYNSRISPNEKNVIFLQKKDCWHLLRCSQGRDKSSEMSYGWILWLFTWILGIIWEPTFVFGSRWGNQANNDRDSTQNGHDFSKWGDFLTYVMLPWKPPNPSSEMKVDCVCNF